MKYYLSPTGQLFAYELDSSQDELIPADFVPATDAQVQAVQNPSAQPMSAASALARLDLENALTQRNFRETVMLMAEAFKQVTNGAVDLTNIPGVAKVYQVEAEAEVLRAQL